MSKAAKPKVKTTEAATDGAAAGDPAAAGAKKGSKKKLILIAALLLLVGGGAGGWFSGAIPKLLGKGGGAEPVASQEEAHGDKPAGHEEKGAEHKAEGKSAKTGSLFMDLPDIIANLNTGSRRAVYVKLKAKLELSKPEDQASIQAALPRVLDLFQGYLREMRPEELRGTAGTYRLREELLARTNLAAPPARVVAVLFTEMIVQ